MYLYLSIYLSIYIYIYIYFFSSSSSHFYTLVFQIPDLALGILNMLICVCFRDMLRAISLKICSWYNMTFSQLV